MTGATVVVTGGTVVVGVVVVTGATVVVTGGGGGGAAPPQMPCPLKLNAVTCGNEANLIPYPRLRVDPAFCLFVTIYIRTVIPNPSAIFLFLYKCFLT